MSNSNSLYGKFKWTTISTQYLKIYEEMFLYYITAST